ncbi:MAG TPA: hypothetical protein VFZ61_14505 [Polyangiales bacterium]
METETLVELPSRLEPLRHVRSTLIQSSLLSLKQRQYFEPYLALLEPAHRAHILETLAPEWMPSEVAMAHYAACEALQLSPAELHAIGEEVGERIQGSFISLLLHNARSEGLSPWVPLGQFRRLYERLLQGGGVRILRHGPREAVVDVRRLALSRFDYFRAGFCGVIACAIKLGGVRSPSVRVENATGHELRCVFKCTW